MNHSFKINLLIFLVLLFLTILYGYFILTRYQLYDFYQANQKIKKELFEEARLDYQKLTNQNPDNHLFHYNLGNLEAKEKKYKEAKEIFEDVSQTADKKLRKKSLYNLGNSYFCLGDLKNAIKSYQSALNLDTKYENAQKNLDFVKKIDSLLKANQQDQIKKWLSDESCFKVPEEKQDQPQNQKNNNSQEQQNQPKTDQPQTGDKSDEKEENKDQNKSEEQAKDQKDDKQEEMPQEQMGTSQEMKKNDSGQHDKNSEKWLNSIDDNPGEALKHLILKGSEGKSNKFEKDW